MSVSTVFGLCLGSHQATVAVHKNGRTEVLANEAGERETPMIVTYKDDNILVGSAAKQALYRNTHCTALAMPLLLGANLEDSHVQTIIQSFDCQVVEKNDKIYYELQSFPDKTCTVTVEEVLGHVLEQLAATAKSCEAVSPIPCVLAVTCNYTDKQTQILRQCVEAAGFQVLSTAVQSTLALLPYGIACDKDSFSGHILVYDLGTRMLTLTLLQCIEGLIRVRKYCTITGIGGAYFDEALLGVLIEECKRKLGKDISGNQRSTQKLLAAAETAKQSLSIQETTSVYIESLYEGMDFQCPVARGRFEGVCQSVLQSCIEPIQEMLSNSNLSTNDINKVILVGGVCRTPRLQVLLQEMFSSSEILGSVSPEHVVAMGTALQGSYHLQYALSKPFPQTIPCVAEDIKLNCVNCVDPVDVVLLKGHTPLPCYKQVTLQFKPDMLYKYVLVQIIEFSNEKATTIAEVEVPSSLAVNGILQLEAELLWNHNETSTTKITITIKDRHSDWKKQILIQ